MQRKVYKAIGRGKSICCLGKYCATGSFRKWAKRNVSKRFRRHGRVMA